MARRDICINRKGFILVFVNPLLFLTTTRTTGTTVIEKVISVVCVVCHFVTSRSCARSSCCFCCLCCLLKRAGLGFILNDNTDNGDNRNRKGILCCLCCMSLRDIPQLRPFFLLLSLSLLSSKIIRRFLSLSRTVVKKTQLGGALFFAVLFAHLRENV